jgi:hypothetical protein
VATHPPRGTASGDVFELARESAGPSREALAELKPASAQPTTSSWCHRVPLVAPEAPSDAIRRSFDDCDDN